MVKHIRNIEKLDILIDNIPVTIFRPKEFNKETKTIIHYHGWTSQVETFFSFGELFAQRGIQVVLPEIANHGVRELDVEQKQYMKFIDSVLSSVDEFEIVTNYLVTNNLINKEEVIISGHSMGGLIVNILRGLWNVKSSITYNGIGDMLEVFKEDLESDSMSDLIPEEREQMDRMIDLNPIGNFVQYDKKRMLILVGRMDETVSPDNMQSFVDKLKTEEIDTSNIKIKYFDKATHDISLDMIREALSYIQKEI